MKRNSFVVAGINSSVRFRVSSLLCPLLFGVFVTGCTVFQTEDVKRGGMVDAAPIPRATLVPHERKELLDWCEQFAAGNGLGGFRTRAFTGDETAIRICIGVNTSRDALLLVERINNKIVARFVRHGDRDRSKEPQAPLFVTPIDNTVWRWIEDSKMVELDSSKADCLAEPAHDSVVIVMEARRGDTYVSQIASEGCCKSDIRSTNLPRFAENLGHKLGVELFACQADVSEENQAL